MAVKSTHICGPPSVCLVALYALPMYKSLGQSLHCLHMCLSSFVRTEDSLWVYYGGSGLLTMMTITAVQQAAQISSEYTIDSIGVSRKSHSSLWLYYQVNTAS